MSIRVMTKIWDEGPENQGELLVLLALSDFADDEGYCWPSMARIARKARMSERNVRRVVRKLEDEGYLKTVQSSGRTSNKYQILTNPDKMSASQPGQMTHQPGQMTHSTRTQLCPGNRH